jgi:hypothetical protein
LARLLQWYCTNVGQGGVGSLCNGRASAAGCPRIFFALSYNLWRYTVCYPGESDLPPVWPPIFATFIYTDHDDGIEFADWRRRKPVVSCNFGQFMRNIQNGLAELAH